MRLLVVWLGVLVLVRPPAVVAQTSPWSSLVGTWLKVEADSEKIYWKPSTGAMMTKKEAPGGNVDSMVPVDAVLVLRSDSTMDFFGMAGEKNVWGSAKGSAFRTKDAKTVRPLGKNDRSDWQVALSGKQLTITIIPDPGPGNTGPYAFGVFQKYADTTAPYGVLQR